jgi:RNA polymerase sigma-70 factor, ECF subfamily
MDLARVMDGLGTPRAETAESEEVLVGALLAGNREAAESLVERTYGIVYGALMKLCGGDSALAADLTQETYRKAWVSLSGFERRARFSTWLYRIAYNTFLNHQRSRNREGWTSLEEIPSLELRDSRPDQEQSLSAREVAERLRRAVLDLPDDERFAVTARFWSEIPVSEIARVVGVSEVAVRKRMRKALSAVRESLNA